MNVSEMPTIEQWLEELNVVNEQISLMFGKKHSSDSANLVPIRDIRWFLQNSEGGAV